MAFAGGGVEGGGGMPLSPAPNLYGGKGMGVSPSGGSFLRRTVDDVGRPLRMPGGPMVRHTPEELLTALRKGTELSKHGRHGKPKMHFFRICEGDTQLSWRSARGNLRFVPLASVKEVVEGQTTDTFRRTPVPHYEHLSFSLLYRGPDEGGQRTLDLICRTEVDYALWFKGLKMVVERTWRAAAAPKVPAPMLRATVGDGAQAAAAPAGGGQAGAPPRPAMAASPGPVAGGGTAQGRITGALGLPVVPHCPGDCYLWGAVRASGPGGKAPGGGADSWWQHSMAPALVANTTHLDVAEVAVGGRHAGLITHSGELHTWGEGCGGKLGQGHYEDAVSPMRVTALWGQPVKHIACGDVVMGAITADGGLWTWGDGAGRGLGYPEALRQAIPRRVDALGDLVLVQVSCGAYHSAAVSAGGSLFTWGNGLCGKLGHGDEESCSSPRQVEALKARRVTHAACGVWHSAAVAAERAEGGDGLGQLPFLEARAVQAKLASMYDLLDGEGGALYTWGGEFTWVERRRDKSGVVVEKRENHRGCLGTGDAAGRLLPTRVGGALDHTPVRQVECGLNLTVAVGLDGRVWQCGETGASGKAKWEGCRSPEHVGGALAGHRIERLAVGQQHVLALGGPMDRRTGRIEEGEECSLIFAWGRGREGQLGTGSLSDSVTPRLVEPLRGRRILQVAAGGHHSAAVCTHDTEREDLGERRRGVKTRMRDWFGAAKLAIDLPGVDRSDGSFGGFTPGAGRPHRATADNGPLDRNGMHLAIPRIIPELEQSVTPRQVGTVDGPGVAGLRRTAAGGAPAMQVAVTGQGAGLLDRVPNALRKHTKPSTHRHSFAVSVRPPVPHGSAGRRLSSPGHDGHPIVGSAPEADYLGAGAAEPHRSGGSFPGSVSAALSQMGASADSEQSGICGRSSLSSLNASRESLPELTASASAELTSGGRPPLPPGHGGGVRPLDIAAVEKEIAEIERVRAELDRRRIELLQQAARAHAASTSSSRSIEPVTPGPTSASKAREYAPGTAPELLATPRSNTSPYRRRAVSEALAPRPTSADGCDGQDMQEPVAEGVFLTFRHGVDGRPNLTRVRFSRQHFSRASAEQWWSEHRRELSRTYNLANAAGAPGLPDPVSASPSPSPSPAPNPAGRPALTPLRIPPSPRLSPARHASDQDARDSPTSTMTQSSVSILSSHALPVASYSDSDASPRAAGTPNSTLGSPMGTPASWVFSLGRNPAYGSAPGPRNPASRLSLASTTPSTSQWDNAVQRTSDAGEVLDAAVQRSATWGRETRAGRPGGLRRGSAGTVGASGSEYSTPRVRISAPPDSSDSDGVSRRVWRLEAVAAAAMEQSPVQTSPFQLSSLPRSEMDDVEGSVHEESPESFASASENFRSPTTAASSSNAEVAGALCRPQRLGSAPPDALGSPVAP